jgi:hypothetical protein
MLRSTVTEWTSDIAEMAFSIDAFLTMQSVHGKRAYRHVDS